MKAAGKYGDRRHALLLSCWLLQMLHCSWRQTKLLFLLQFFFYKQTHTAKIKHISKSILSGKTPVKGRMYPAVLWLSWLFLYKKLLHFKNDCYNYLSDKPAGLWEVNQQQVGAGRKKLAKYTPNVKDRSEATLQKWLADACILLNTSKRYQHSVWPWTHKEEEQKEHMKENHRLLFFTLI